MKSSMKQFDVITSSIVYSPSVNHRRRDSHLDDCFSLSICQQRQRIQRIGTKTDGELNQYQVNESERDDLQTSSNERIGHFRLITNHFNSKIETFSNSQNNPLTENQVLALFSFLITAFFFRLGPGDHSEQLRHVGVETAR